MPQTNDMTSEEFKCNICGKICKTRHGLEKHIGYIHTSEFFSLTKAELVDKLMETQTEKQRLRERVEELLLPISGDDVPGSEYNHAIGDVLRILGED